MKIVILAILLAFVSIGISGALVPDNAKAYALYKQALYYDEVPIVPVIDSITQVDNQSPIVRFHMEPAAFDTGAMLHGGTGIGASTPELIPFIAYPNATARYKDLGISIPSQGTFNKTLLGQMGPDVEKNQFNPGIGIVVDLLKPGATNPMFALNSAIKYRASDQIAIVSASRVFDVNRQPQYVVTYMPTNGYGDMTVKKVKTYDLGTAYNAFMGFLEPNLAAWDTINQT